MMNKILLFISSFFIWIFFGWPPDFQHLIIGLFVSWLIMFLLGDLFSGTPKYFFEVKRYFWFGFYVIYLLLQCLKANIYVAFMVFNPKCGIRPGIVKVRTNLKSATALAFLANSITLAPGTISVDIKPENGILYVHWINVRSDNIQETTQLLSYKLELILKRIFE